MCACARSASYSRFALLPMSSFLRRSCSHTDCSPSCYLCRYTIHPPCAWCMYYLQLLGTFAGIPPGMVSALSPGELVVTFLGTYTIVFGIDLSFPVFDSSQSAC